MLILDTASGKVFVLAFLPMVPAQSLPRTGLFNDTADYCRTPSRFLLRPWLLMLTDPASDRLRYRPAALFGHASCKPPVPLKAER